MLAPRPSGAERAPPLVLLLLWISPPSPALSTKLGQVHLLKFFELEGRFPRHLGELPRQAVEYVAQQVKVPATDVGAYDWADWDAQAMDELRVRRLAARSPAGGALVLDDTGLPKQGKRSVGVARQYSGTLGKIGNCQVLVSAEYVAPPLRVSRPAHWPVAGRLYLPERWARDPQRRREARIPDEITFQTQA